MRAMVVTASQEATVQKEERVPTNLLVAIDTIYNTT